MDNKLILNVFKSDETCPRNVLMVTESWQTAWESIWMVNEIFEWMTGKVKMAGKKLKKKLFCY